MASSGNFPTIGGLEKNTGGFTFSQGNLKYSVSTNQRGFICSAGFPDTGKWYYEMYIIGVGGTQDQVFMGVCNPDTMRANLTQDRGGATGTYGGYTYDNYNGKAYLNGTAQTADSIGYFRSFPQKVGILVNRDDNKIQWTLNGTDVSSAYTIPTGPLYPYLGSGGGSTEASGIFNFGQDSTFGGAVSAGGNADGNGFGDFTFSVPSNYLALSSANLPTSSDIDPAETDDDHPAKNFGILTYTGTGTSRTLSGLGFQPDLIWAKRRSGTAKRHYLVDSSRGFTKYLHPEGIYTEGTSTDGVTSATSDGFVIGGTGNLDYVNESTATYVAWCWRCNGGTTATNTDGDLTSTVQVNQALGFSISQYTSNGTGQSFGHGLGAAPDFFTIKKRLDQDRNWMSWHTGLTTASTGYIRWNLTNAEGNDTLWNNTAPSSTVISVQKDTTEVNNPSGAQYICYAWRSIEGYSKFGKFEGNGNADGPFVYLGFRPRLVFFKNIDAAENWQVRDTARHSNTGSQTRLYWNSDAAEGAASTASPIDFLANGFKIRGSNTEINGNTVIYGAWGDVPFKYGNTF